MTFRIKTIVPIVIILLAAFLRFYKFEEFVTFLGDQGRDAIIIKRIVTFEHWPAIGAPSSLGQIFLGPFYYYLIAPFLLLFNFNPAGLAYGVALLSLFGIVTAYKILKQETDRLTAFVFLIFTSFSTINIQSSRFSWNPNLLPLFSFFTLYFFYKFLTTKNIIFAIAFGSFLAFSVQLHHLTFLLFLPISLIYFIFSLKNKTMKQWNNLAIAAISFLFFSLPLIIFDLRHDFLNARSFIRLLTEGNPAESSNFLSKFLTTNSSLYSHVFQTDVNQYVALFTSLTISIFTVHKLRNKPKLFILISFVSWLLYLVLFSLFNTARIAHYYNPIFFSFFLLLAWVTANLTKNKLIKYLLIFLTVLIYSLLNFKGLNYIFTSEGNNQIKRAEKIAAGILERKPQLPYQTVALPYVETDGHIRYFLEVKGKRPLSADTLSDPKELYAICFEKDLSAEDGWCRVLGNAQWQIAAFKNAKIDSNWTVEGVKIYKLIHQN